MKAAPYRALSLGLALALLLAFARPAAAHRLEDENPEPDHILYRAGVILYPMGDFVNHLLFGPHEKDASADKAPDEGERRKPKQNFSPRKKHPQEHSEPMEKEEQLEKEQQ